MLALTGRGVVAPLLLLLLHQLLNLLHYQLHLLYVLLAQYNNLCVSVTAAQNKKTKAKQNKKEKKAKNATKSNTNCKTAQK